MDKYVKSQKLDNVCYDIRGPVMEEARRLEEEGYAILKLNIGNPAPFDLFAPEEMIHDVIINLPNAQGYVDAKGLFSARKAVVQECQTNGIPGVDIEDVYIGNGVSELITMAMQGLLNRDDEILVPIPDYPLWTAAVTLSGGRAVHYVCDEQAGWYPDLTDLENKISSRTKGIVVINPNNPTGSVYPREILEKIVALAEAHNLLLFSDEIYDKIVYDDAVHVPLGSLSDQVMTVTFAGLSKVYRAAGFRAGWMIVSGKKSIASDYIEGLNILSNMRLCSNVPSQYAIQTALGGYQSVREYVEPGGRLYQQREICYNMLVDIPGISCVKPMGALYLFPKIDTEMFGISDDRQFVLDLLKEKKILIVQGTGFNWPQPDHVRIVFLPREDDLKKACEHIRDFLLSRKGNV